MSYDHILTVDEQKELLRIARTTVKEFLVSGRTPPGAPHRESLTTPAGVFVSLHDRHDVLRGCIGTVLEAQPLYKAVQEMAVAAATRDPRYRPVKLDELPKLTVEVSVLGERRVVTSPGEIQIGVHGLQVISQPPRAARGLLLPKVAVDQGWDVETFLARTCDKADLESDWWKDALAGQGGVVERFTAQVFDEKTLQVGPYAPPSGQG